MYCCSECGGTNVQVQAWVDANTSEYLSDVYEDCLKIYEKLKEINNGSVWSLDWRQLTTMGVCYQKDKFC